MKIYHGRVPMGNFQNFYWYKPGKIACRLVGINFFEGVAEPVYLPVIRFEKAGEFLIIEFSWNSPFLLVVIMPNKPFIHIERPEGFHMEEL